MSKIEVDLQKLSTLEVEINLMEKRKLVLQTDLESLTKEVNSLKDKTNKEIAQQKQQNDAECQEKINEANKVLKDTKEKFKIAEQREKDSEAINEQIKKLNEKQSAVADSEKQAQTALSLATEKEHNANLLIEQYTKKLDEIGGVAKEKVEEKKEEKKSKKK